MNTADTVLARLRIDTPFYAEELLKIIPKERRHGLVPLKPKEGQLELDRLLELQRAAGKPMRAIVLKARQTGMSTWVQAKLIQAATLTEHLNALVVAHDVDTGGKLFGIGQRMYSNLPNEPQLKPPIRSHKRARFMHFGQRGDVWMNQAIKPDSTYWVDTAGEFESGRGGTYHMLHLSEFAFWPQAQTKLTALGQTIPDDPETLLVIESTANGHNHFKSIWDDAVEGRSEYIAFFWPWWKEPEYSRPFATAEERAEFRVGDLDQSPYAEREHVLADPGPFDPLTGEHVPLTLEQLHWRRWAIANPERGAGRIETFDQEYPTEPDDAFMATGSKVFDPVSVARAMRQAEQTDPRVGQGGPLKGAILAGARPMRAGRLGKIEVPTEPYFKPARMLAADEMADWRLWLDEKDGKPVVPEERRYVVGVDVSEGLPESDDEGGDPAYQAIVVIDHESKAQVAEYRSRVDADLLAEIAVLTAEFFNDAWLAIEKTGPGLAVVRKVYLDFRYRFTYFRRKHESRMESQLDRLGWSTDRSTKPLLIAGGAELLREQTHGIHSRRLVSEMTTYIRRSTGKLVPETGKFSDLLMAWLIAQQVALEQPLRKKTAGRPGPAPARDPVTGYGGLARGRVRQGV